MKKIVSGLLVISLFLLIACSDNDQLTGSSVIEVSTLDVIVRNENGSLLPGAEIYVNDVYKGKTTKYGENIGVKTVVLSGGKNKIHAEKEGYVASEPTSVSASLKGHQQMSVFLEKKKTNVLVEVESREEPVEEARVSLYREDRSMVESDYTDEEGRVDFKQVDDGNYILSVSKEGFELYNQDEEINYLDDGDELELKVDLVLLSGLDIEVFDTVGEPLPFAEVTLFSENDYNRPGGLPIATEMTPRSGKLHFSSVDYDDKYVVVVKKEDYLAQSQEIWLKPEQRELRFEMIFDID